MIPLITARVHRGRIQYTVTAGDTLSLMEIAHFVNVSFRNNGVTCFVDYHPGTVVITPRTKGPSRLSDVRQARLDAEAGTR